MNVPANLLYTAEHEWLSVVDGEASIGITQYAVEQLGEIVFVELPARDAQIRRGDAFGAVESVKAVSDLFAPVSGRVVDVNQSLVDDPATLNESAYEAWIVRIEIADRRELDELLDASGYRDLLDG